MSAFEVDVVVDIANGAEGFFGGAGRAANRSEGFGAASDGVAFADEDTAGLAGAACCVALRGIGRGFGNGTASAPCGTSARTAAPNSKTLRRLRRADLADAGLADEEANGVTDGLYGESLKSLHFSGVEH